jgi:hypothetical protein
MGINSPAVALTAFVSLVAQSGASSHVVIPFLANAGTSTVVDFEGAECELDAGGNSMDCIFQQVFLTTSPVAADTCFITTNRYERIFRRETATRWVSTEGPDGVCGVVDVATLIDEGGVKWTMEMHKVVTKKDAADMCQSIDPAAETFSWQNIRRPLTCAFVQPGGLSR